MQTLSHNGLTSIKYKKSSTQQSEQPNVKNGKKIRIDTSLRKIYEWQIKEKILNNITIYQRDVH